MHAVSIRRWLGVALLCVAGGGWAQSGSSANMVCGADLNGDGYIDSSTEMASCKNYSAWTCGTTTQACSSTTQTCQSQLEACTGQVVGGLVHYSCPGGNYPCGMAPTGGMFCTVPPPPNCQPGTTYSCPGDSTQTCSPDSTGQEVCKIPDTNCHSDPNSGWLCPLQAQSCQLNSAGSWTCPIGSQYPCLGPAGQTPQCSANACVDSNNPGGVTQPVSNDPTPVSTGPQDPNTGQCEGQIRIFPGRAASCRGQGLDTAWMDCCKATNTVHDTMGSTSTDEQKPKLASALSSVIPFYPQCQQAETQTGLERQSNLCVWIGDYCSDNWPLVGCVQQTHSYCCFDSMLAEIIQVQGRAQIPSMGGFGTPQSPNCRGFSPEEFQSLDFSKIDLSSYYSQLEYNSQSTIESELNTSAVPPHQ